MKTGDNVFFMSNNGICSGFIKETIGDSVKIVSIVNKNKKILKRYSLLHKKDCFISIELLFLHLKNNLNKL